MASEVLNGFLRDTGTRDVVCVFAAQATLPVEMQNGFLRDADGRLVVVNPSG